MRLRSLLVLTALVFTGTASIAQTAERYLVLSTARTKTLRAELELAVSQGYSLIAGDPASDLLILEKKPSDQQRKYHVEDNLIKAIEKGDYKGYHVLAWSFSRSNAETAAIFESLVEGEPQPEYKLSSTVRTRNLQKDVNEASAGGFRAVAITGLDGQAALLERFPDSPATTVNYLLLATKKISTMEKELEQAVALGYRVVGATGAGTELLVLLEAQPQGAKPRDYKLISTTRTSTFEKELNQAAAAGYRIVPLTGAALQKSGLVGGSVEQAIMMERIPNAEPVRYMFLGARREKTLQRELNAAPSECKVQTMFLSFQEAVVLLACPPE